MKEKINNKETSKMNKKIATGLLTVALASTGVSAFAANTTVNTSSNNTVTVSHATGLQNALTKVTNPTARQAIQQNIDRQNGTITTGDTVSVDGNTAATADTVSVNPTATADTVIVKVNGRVLSFDSQPVIQHGRTIVPLRSIFEALGVNIQWDGKTGTVKANKGAKKVMLKIGSPVATVNNKAVTLDEKAQIIKGRTMVPLRFVSESLGAKVTWNAATHTAVISAQ
jgi:hypothetical protein